MTIETSGLECDERINEFVEAGYSINKMDRLVYERVGENPIGKKQFVTTTEIEPPMPKTAINL